jgi:hypothetical protein
VRLVDGEVVSAAEAQQVEHAALSDTPQWNSLSPGRLHADDGGDGSAAAVLSPAEQLELVNLLLAAVCRPHSSVQRLEQARFAVRRCRVGTLRLC